MPAIQGLWSAVAFNNPQGLAERNRTDRRTESCRPRTGPGLQQRHAGVGGQSPSSPSPSRPTTGHACRGRGRRHAEEHAHQGKTTFRCPLPTHSPRWLLLPAVWQERLGSLLKHYSRLVARGFWAGCKGRASCPCARGLAPPAPGQLARTAGRCALRRWVKPTPRKRYRSPARSASPRTRRFAQDGRVACGRWCPSRGSRHAAFQASQRFASSSTSWPR
jgi:hypothetical protein